jgi:hypothetical protein
MDISFSPCPDVTAILNALLDILERRSPKNNESTEHATRYLEPSPRTIKITLSSISLPSYFSQTDPEPRIIANRQLQELEELGLLKLTWLPGEAGHLLHTLAICSDNGTRETEHATRYTPYAPLYTLLHRSPLAASRTRLETVLLADQFRFPPEDWRARAVHHTLSQLRAGKSPTPFSLADAEWNLDLLTVLASLPGLEAETPYRVFSVRIFNDSKRFDELKPALVRLARRSRPEWKSLPGEEILRELNLVANPNTIHLAGNWQMTTANGEVLALGGFVPSIGFPAAQIADLRAISVHAGAVLCIENLTTFHEFVRAQAATQRNTLHASRTNPHYAILCTMGNPSPAIRRLLGLLPQETPIHLWADLDYGGFNILSQLRQQVRPGIQPYRMDIAALETCAPLSRPLTRNDTALLKKLLSRSELLDVYPVIQHLLQRGLKLEQEAFDLQSPIE